MAEAPTIRREWHWHFDLPPETIWPVLADTARFNEAAKAPTYQLEEIARPDGSVLRKGAAKVAGMAMAWEEKPYEWVLNKSFRQVRGRPLEAVEIEIRQAPIAEETVPLGQE